tara:strand:+ start:8414 stop:11653 length:3240 start_codon:yes stop_codon:yes gene_type:complete
LNKKEISNTTLKSIRSKLQNYPDSLKDNFEISIKFVSEIFSVEETKLWALIGLKIAQVTTRSWESSLEYYKATPDIIKYLPFNYIIQWGESGLDLSNQSPTLASSYFKASKNTIKKLRSRHIDSWALTGKSLYNGTWKSSTLACQFFEHSPALVKSLTFPQIEKFTSVLKNISDNSFDIASDSLSISTAIFPIIGKSNEEFINLLPNVIKLNLRELKGFLESCSKSLNKIDSNQRINFIKIIIKLMENGELNIPNHITEMANNLNEINKEEHESILELATTLEGTTPIFFINSTPKAFEKLTNTQLIKWVETGKKIYKTNVEGGVAFFKIESSYSEQVIENLSSSIELSKIKEIMELYCRGLAGSEIKLENTGDLVEKNIGWVSNESPSTEGSTVYLPAVTDRYTSKIDNFNWYKVVSTHQVAHVEFGSFQFNFSKPSNLFKDLRYTLEEKKLNNDENYKSQTWLTDIQRFFNMFTDRQLSLDIFTVVEDGRLDERIKYEYPGVKNPYIKIQTDTLKRRKPIQELPAREALVELIIRIGLQELKSIPVPKKHKKSATDIVSIAKQVFDYSANIEDVAEATLRIYAIISQISNENIDQDDWDNIDIDDINEEYNDSNNMDELIDNISQNPDMSELNDDEEYTPSEQVDYRGDFKPELSQLLNELRSQGDMSDENNKDSNLTQQMLEEMFQSSAEIDVNSNVSEMQNASGKFANNILKETGVNINQQDYGDGVPSHIDEDGGSLDPNEPQTFVYDEWDFRAGDYKPRWCIVHQKEMPEGDPNFYSTTLHSYKPLVQRIQRQFEMMVPEMFRKVRKLDDGEDFDIDDVIEAMIDIKTGNSPNEKFYWRRNKVQRDVAVALLLDTSASTAEAIDDSKKPGDDWDAPDDPVKYMEWLKNRKSEGSRRNYKRIIDVEKESIVLLINALESIGDMYGIYGFSGYGRENVEFYNIKDLNENFSDNIKQRIDRISPLHATRMGPAIRHTITKLKKAEARTKLLFLISDGRPQDRGYSREGVEKEYAVHDTKMALDEAKQEDINAFCLTVDKSGHDYLKTMCEDIGYEVLDDIHALPERLLYLYRRLTM